MKNLKLSAFIFLSFIFFTNLFAQEKKDPLNNQSFAINVVEKNRMGKEEKMKDIIRFKDDLVSTKFSKENEFPDAVYSYTTKDAMLTNVITFKAESSNKKDKLVWEGIVNGDDIEGVATRERKGEIRTMYEFTGTKK